MIKKFENYKDLNYVLDKISSNGIKSLDNEEKKFLKNWNEFKKLNKELNISFESESFKMNLKNIIKKEDIIIFTIDLYYNNDLYKGDVYYNPETHYFDWSNLENLDNKSIDPDPDDLYELDNFIDDMIIYYDEKISK